jgi:hypothetical protein
MSIWARDDRVGAISVFGSHRYSRSVLPELSASAMTLPIRSWT